jgi:hypothetical protein
MKTFTDYLSDSKKVYEFVVRIAGELPEDFSNKVERSLNKYEVLKCAQAKTTPIAESQLDFPRLKNIEVTHYEVELSYPVTTAVLESYIADETGVAASHIVVRNPNEPMERLTKDNTDEAYEPLLTKEELEYETAQGRVGQARIMDLLQELEVARKERSTDFATGESSN